MHGGTYLGWAVPTLGYPLSHPDLLTWLGGGTYLGQTTLVGVPSPLWTDRQMDRQTDGQTRVKTLPSRRTTYRGGKNKKVGEQ